MIERFQAFSFEPGVFCVVDTLNGEELLSLEDEYLIGQLANAANYFFALQYEDRLRALHANRRALQNIFEEVKRESVHSQSQAADG